MPASPRRGRGSGQIVEHRLVGRMQPRRKEHATQPRECTHLGFMADDDGAQTVGRRADRESALGVQPHSVRGDREGMRSNGSHHRAAQFDRVCLPPEDERLEQS